MTVSVAEARGEEGGGGAPRAGKVPSTLFSLSFLLLGGGDGGNPSVTGFFALLLLLRGHNG